MEHRYGTPLIKRPVACTIQTHYIADMVTYLTKEPTVSRARADSDVPLFIGIAQGLERDVLDGTLSEGSQAPSTNDISAFHEVNPATALRALNHLVDSGVLYKKRGIGMFVTDGARTTLLNERRVRFGSAFVEPLLAEATAIGLSRDAVIEEIRKAIGDE